jgi:hypothetical protein
MAPAVRIPTPSVAFPTLAVSSRDAKTLERIGDAHVQETLERYREFIDDHKESVDRKMWRKVRSCHGVKVFRERRRSAIKRERFEKSGSSIKTRESNDRDVTPLMLLVGTLQGNLDDVLYGIQSPSTETMQLQTSYVQDGLSDWAVLASIIKPSRADPFRELSLKWAVKRHAMPIGALMRPRDLVYMESVGFTTTRSGEQVGYQVKHSVDLAGAKELSEHNIARAHLSFCYIYRQRTENVVDVFMRGTISPTTSSTLSNMASCSVATDIALSVARISYCAQMKKLSWLLKTGKQVLFPGRGQYQQQQQQCGVCAEVVPCVSSARKAHKKSCRICCERVCSRCRVTKQLGCITSLDDQDVVVTTSMRFCTRCIHRASQVNAQSVALHDIIEAEGNRDPERAFDVIRKLRIDSISTCSLDDNYSQHSSLYTQ